LIAAGIPNWSTDRNIMPPQFWRRHKHELEFPEDSIPPTSFASETTALDFEISPGNSIPAPRKRQRYSRADDILIARYFASRPLPTGSTSRAKGKSQEERDSTSQDAMFREFALSHPQHPWKGWQEHYRMHKVCFHCHRAMGSLINFMAAGRD
jgi:hypothetical protein